MTTTEKSWVAIGAAILLSILGWMGGTFYGKLAEIDKSLQELRIEVTRIQAISLTRDDVREMIRYEAIRRHTED